ncbi:efflux RND transporter periplasmic adaptor subunit [uncultured Cohaesibacter sp.]|uniref:efflux RND transporter periplasmic adaptor subunit n=1 Tax=uncultured Cohaesibacter sp. TaxID=1002546 RepID=UPI0029C69444|nr:efflux RND transporter periplasmic adaptor subunit [uncultured Cohaesibacter sp.]
MKKATPVAAVVAVVMIVLAGFVLMAMRREQPPGQQTSISPQITLTVTETRIRKVDWPEMIKASGSIFAWHEALVSAQLSGLQLIEVRAEAGDRVRKGQILARLETRMLYAEYAELKANWISAEANRERALRLQKTRSISEKAVDDAINLASVAKAKLDAKSLQLDYSDILAPDDGTISSRSASLGAVVNAGDELFRIIRQDKLEWLAELTADQARQVEPGQSVVLSLPDGSIAGGTVSRLAPTYSQQTRMIPLHVALAKTPALRPGMYVGGQILLGQENVSALPTRSLIIRDGYSYVFTIQDQTDGPVVRQVRVETGQINGDETAIQTELGETDRIVLQGAGFLNDGDHVRVVSQEGTER